MSCPLPAVLNLRHTWRQDGTAGPNGSSENHNIWSPVQGRTPMQATVEITQEIDSYVTVCHFLRLYFLRHTPEADETLDFTGSRRIVLPDKELEPTILVVGENRYHFDRWLVRGPTV